MKKTRCYIKRNMTHTAPVEVPPWELQILRAIHGADKIEVLGQVEVDMEVPYLDTEAERLIKRFGVIEESGIPWFVQVFGAEDRGLRALAEEIQRATGVEPERKPEGADTPDFEIFEDVTAKKVKKPAGAAA